MRACWFLVISAACGRFGFKEEPTMDATADADGMAHLVVQHMGTGTGTVVGPNGFSCTSGDCSLAVPPGTTVTLRGLAAADNWFAGWTGPCGGNFECTFDAATDTNLLAEFTPTPNRVFVTSTTTDGNIGGVAGADAMCAARATAAGLSGTYVAFLSDTANNASTRFASSRGFVRTDGAPFADAPTSFANGKMIFPARLDEYGNDLGNVSIYTGTNWGAIVAKNCTDWTDNSGAGSGASTTGQYAAAVVGSYPMSCANTAHLLCVETGRVQPVTIHPDTGKLAFASATLWTPGNGRASADAVCAADAMTAGFSGTFLAAMATTTSSIASRFPAANIYRRSDGVRLSRTPGMLTQDWLDVPPELDMFGSLVESDIWTGANRFDAIPALADNCNDWSDGTGGNDGYMHYTFRTDLRSPSKTDLCSSNIPVLCLEL